MVVFAIETKTNGIVQGFMEATHKRLQSCRLAENPFSGGIVRIRNTCTAPIYHDKFLIDMTPLYPPTYLGGLFIIIPTLVWRGLTLNGFLVAGLILLSTGLLWSRYFMFVMLKLGIRKAGHRGPIKLIKDNEILNYLMYHSI